MRPVAALAGLALLAGCDDDRVDPITRITGPRVLAVTTEPSVLALDGDLQLTVWTVDPDGPRTADAAASGGRSIAAVRMRACAPWKFISDPARDCAGVDALALASNAEGHIVTSAAALAAAFPSPPGLAAPPDPWRAALAAGLALRVPIIAEIDVDGETLVARRDLDVVETAVARHNPRIAEIRFDGIATSTLRAGQRYALTVTFDPASLDAAPDPEPPRRRERARCNFYSAAGELAEREAEVDQPDLAVPETKPAAFTAGAPGPTWLYVVAADDTGGLSVAWRLLTIE